MLVRDIIDLDTNFLDDDKLKKTIKENNKKEGKEEKNKDDDKKEGQETTDNSVDDEDEYNISLASLEIELKPKILETFKRITKKL